MFKNLTLKAYRIITIAAASAAVMAVFLFFRLESDMRFIAQFLVSILAILLIIFDPVAEWLLMDKNVRRCRGKEELNFWFPTVSFVATMIMSAVGAMLVGCVPTTPSLIRFMLVAFSIIIMAYTMMVAFFIPFDEDRRHLTI